MSPTEFLRKLRKFVRAQSGMYFSSAGRSVTRNGLDWIFTSVFAGMPRWYQNVRCWVVND